MDCTTSQTGRKIAQGLGWFWIVLGVAVLIVFGTIRFSDMAAGERPRDEFEVRYVEHPVVAAIHMAPGLIFLTLSPLQFIARIRNRKISFHRGLGRVLVLCALISGIFGIAAGFRLPAFGGLTTIAATLFFGAIFLVSLVKAVIHIRAKRVAQHREWMIRVFALALGVANIRLFIAILAPLTGSTMEEVFGTAFWLGFGVTLLTAEIWIQQTRHPKIGV